MRSRDASLSLFPDLVGVGRRRARRSLAPQLPTSRVQYRPLPCSTILCENRNRALPFRWSINPYRGCAYGCPFCFARYTHAYLDHDDPLHFQSRIYVKFQAPQVLEETIRSTVLRGGRISIGSVTDPYQPGERRFGVTRRILERLPRLRNLDLTITTRSPLILRDREVLRTIAKRSTLSINISLITLNPTLARIVERGAPAPRRRLETIRALHREGIEVGLFVMPILRGINDSSVELRALLRSGHQAGARYATADPVRLSGPSWTTFEKTLTTHFPQLVEQYRERADRGARSWAQWRRSVLEQFSAMRAATGLEGSPIGRFHASSEVVHLNRSLFDSGNENPNEN